MIHDPFDLSGRVAVITGGAGLLGIAHARAIRGAGGIPVLLDIASPGPSRLRERAGFEVECLACDITREAALEGALRAIISLHGRVDILVNNAANNPKVEAPGGLDNSRLENYPIESWQADLAVGLTGAICCAAASSAARWRGGARA